MRPRKGLLWNFWGISGRYSRRWDQNLMLPHIHIAYCSAAIKQGEFNDNLKTLFWSQPEDFAMRKELAEIIITEYDFACKWKRNPIFEHFKPVWPTLTKQDNTMICNTIIKTSKSGTAWFIEDLITAHHSYAFLKSWEGQRCGGITDQQTISQGQTLQSSYQNNQFKQKLWDWHSRCTRRFRATYSADHPYAFSNFGRAGGVAVIINKTKQNNNLTPQKKTPQKKQ